MVAGRMISSFILFFGSAISTSLRFIPTSILSKKSGLLSYTMKGAVLEVLGTALSLGITVDGKNAAEIQKLIKAG